MKPNRWIASLASIAVATLATTTIASISVPDRAAAEDQAAKPVSGTTSGGKKFSGTVAVRGDQVIAEVDIEGAGKQTLTAAASGDRPVDTITIKEGGRSADGAQDRLDGLLDEDGNPRGEATPTFEMTPVFGAAPAPEPDEVPTGFDVEIVRKSGAALDPTQEYLVGEKVELKAQLKAKDGAPVPPIDQVSFAWRVPGSQVKDLNLELTVTGTTLWDGRKSGAPGEDRYIDIVDVKSTALAAADKRAQEIAFFWKTEGSGRQEISVTVRSRDGYSADAKATILVKRSPYPARQVFTVAAKTPASFSILPEHDTWHARYGGGSRFIQFHREWLRMYNAWRAVFGYATVRAEFRSGRPGYGVAKPGYLRASGRNERGHTVRASPARSNTHNARKLTDFDTIDDLGDDLESPWHNDGHVAIWQSRTGFDAASAEDEFKERENMIRTSTAPASDLFYRWHTKVDEVAKEWEAAKP